MRWLLAAVLLLGLAGVLAVQFLPGLVESRLNTTHAPPPYPVSVRAGQRHAQLLVADLHADSLLWSRDLLRRADRGHVDLPRLIEGNVALQAFTIVTQSPRGQNIERNSADSDRITALTVLSGWPPRTWNSRYQRAVYQIERLHEYARRSQGALTIVKTRADLDAYLADKRPGDGRVAAWIGIEGAHALDGELANLQRLHARGLRMAGLTHFFDNALAGSMHGIDKGGLTPLGREAVARMQASGILVDLAHASSATIEEVLDISRAPLVVSHAGVKGTCDNNRNLTDAQIRRIAAGGGVIGIGFWPTAVCGRDAAAIVRAIWYVTDLVGAAHVAYGSDFDGSVPTPFDASGMARLTEALLAAGFSGEQIEMISGGNVIRLLRSVLPVT